MGGLVLPSIKKQKTEFKTIKSSVHKTSPLSCSTCPAFSPSSPLALCSRCPNCPPIGNEKRIRQDDSFFSIGGINSENIGKGDYS
jgi:hypothetical protein